MNIRMMKIIFFLPRQDMGFSVNNWNEHLTKNKINRQQMNDFIYQVNTVGQVTEKLAKGKQMVYSKKKTCCTAFVLGFIAFVVCLTLFIYNTTKPYRNFSLTMHLITLLGFVISFFVCCVSGITRLLYQSDKVKDYFIDKEIVTNISIAENLINDWNNKCFIPNGMYVMAPLNLKYLQFVLDPNIKFVMENHQYPFDLIRTRR